MQGHQVLTCKLPVWNAATLCTLNPILQAILEALKVIQVTYHWAAVVIGNGDWGPTQLPATDKTWNILFLLSMF